ncbi:cation diffusion facilitator CzcD-associated flavoprotein CzcO [Bradyrhizobium sp. LM6.11]
MGDHARRGGNAPFGQGRPQKQARQVATMNVAVRSHVTTKQASEHFDVLIVGAGISGIGSAYHMTKQLPGASFVILETQATFGGTWTTHRYPGIRSDSDLHTFGYSFKPWVGPPIATAEEILTYMNEVIDDNDIARHIRYKHKIISASWSSEQNLWTIEAVTTDTGESKTFTANFLWMCQGYYQPFGRLHAGMEGHGPLQGPHRSSADLA